jgi:hypothetical protein
VNFRELLARLKELDVTVPPGTIRRWVTEGHITPPARRPKSKGEGPGTVSDWSQQTLEEIAAIWAVKRYGSGRRNLHMSIKQAKAWAAFFYQDPIGWEHKKQRLYENFYGKGKVIESILARDGDDPDLRLGEAVFRMDLFDFTEWVAAIEKVRHGWRLSDHGYCDFVFTYSGDLFDKTLKYCFYASRFISFEEAKQSEVRIVIFEHEALQNALTAKKQAQMAANMGTPPSEKEVKKGD